MPRPTPGSPRKASTTPCRPAARSSSAWWPRARPTSIPGSGRPWNGIPPPVMRSCARPAAGSRRPTARRSSTSSGLPQPGLHRPRRLSPGGSHAGAPRSGRARARLHLLPPETAHRHGHSRPALAARAAAARDCLACASSSPGSPCRIRSGSRPGSTRTPRPMPPCCARASRSSRPAPSRRGRSRAIRGRDCSGCPPTGR